MPRPPLRRIAIPLAAALAVVVGVVQVRSGDSWGEPVVAIGMTALVLWTLAALARLGAATSPRRPARRSAVDDAMEAGAGWLFQVVSLILVLGAVVGGIAWVAVRVYRLLP